MSQGVCLAAPLPREGHQFVLICCWFFLIRWPIPVPTLATLRPVQGYMRRAPACACSGYNSRPVLAMYKLQAAAMERSAVRGVVLSVAAREKCWLAA